MSASTGTTHADDTSDDERAGAPRVSEREAREVAEAARESGWSKPSFAKELYLGRFDLDLVHPHPRPDPDDEARGEAFLARLREVCATIDGARIEREAQIPDEDLKALAELGAFGMKIPVEYGGLGLTMRSYGRALMLVGSVHPAFGALLSAHQSIGVPEPVKLFGTPEQKERFLPRCARGAISAFLLTEPDVGSDPARMESTATLTDDGTAYLLDGVKLWTTNGVVAELLVVMARGARSTTAGRGGITAFVVEGDAPGITVERRNGFMGLRGIENGADPAAPGAGAGGEPARQGGRGAEDRAHHAQRRAAVDPGDVLGHRQVVAEDRARVVGRAGAVGSARRQARGRRREDRLHRGHRLRAWSRWSS